MKLSEYEEAIRRTITEGQGWVEVKVVDPYKPLPWYRRLWQWLTS